GSVTRKIVLQPGQRVNFSSAIVCSAARERHPSFFAVPDVDSKPSLAGGDHRGCLRLQYPRQNDVSACSYTRGKQRRKQLQRVGEDVRDHDIVCGCLERFSQIEARDNIVPFRVLATGGDGLRIDVDAVNGTRTQLRGSDSENAGPATVIEHRRATGEM